MTKFIAITSGKGGAGKTTTTINLACALSGFGADVVVVDANPSTPHVALSLGSANLDNTLNDALKGKKHITDTAYLHPSGLKIIPCCISVEEIGKDISGLRNVLFDLIGTTDWVLMDTSAGISDATLKAMKAADDLIVVTNPNCPSVADAIKIIKLAEKNNQRVLGAIINRSAGDKIELPQKNVAAMLDVPILGVIPEDISIKKSLTLQQPVVYLYPDSPSANAFKKIAADLMGQEYDTDIQEREEDENSIITYIFDKLQK